MCINLFFFPLYISLLFTASINQDYFFPVYYIVIISPNFSTPVVCQSKRFFLKITNILQVTAKEEPEPKSHQTPNSFSKSSCSTSRVERKNCDHFYLELVEFLYSIKIFRYLFFTSFTFCS